MTDLTKSPDLRSREKIEDYFGDWKWREGLAELMVPIVGRLYRHGVHIMIYGQSLVNKSPIDIMHAHRFTYVHIHAQRPICLYVATDKHVCVCATQSGK